jgi:thiamine pyrophosphokinase
MKTVIFANGELNDIKGCKALISNNDMIIAADGGSLHCENLSITPKLIIGDLDSIPRDYLETFIERGTKIIQHESDKDQTDLELALLYALEAGSKEVLILGGLGNRWDHSLANLLLTAKDNFINMRISFYAGGDYFYIVSNQIEIKGSIGQTISILPLREDAVGVSTTGLQWPLKNETVAFGSSRGMSNLLVSEKANISVTEGVLLVIKNKI